jgi:hypothetical protein
MKSIGPFLAVLILIIMAAWGYASFDQITPVVVEARAATSAGPVAVDVFNQALSLLFKFVLGAMVAGALGFAWSEVRKKRALWWREETTRRWRGGPNAQFQQRTTLPKLKREDLNTQLLLALMSGKRPPQVGVQEERSQQDEINLNF